MLDLVLKEIFTHLSGVNWQTAILLVGVNECHLCDMICLKKNGMPLVTSFPKVMWTQEYFPTVLSRGFVKYCMNNTIQSDDLIDSFKKYVSPDENALLERVLSPDVSVEDIDNNEELKDFLDDFKCRSLVKKDNISEIVSEIALQELVQKPHIMASCWQDAFSVIMPVLGESIDDIYQRMEPSSKKVIKLLCANTNIDAEKESFGYLKRYIKGLELIELKKLLKFLTGADTITIDCINVTFYASVSEFQRRPIAHTCGPMLELPSNL